MKIDTSIIKRLFSAKDPKSVFLGRQLLFSQIPPSVFVENYLLNNEGQKQSLEKFPMLREIYNNLPQKLLLKCSRKTLKSTLLSNMICLNLVRWNNYHMLYVAPQETSTKLFSNAYVAPRFDSPEVKKLFVTGWAKNDVYEKIFGDTKSSVLFRYAKDDATRCRGPATDHNIHDEVQDISFEVLPIIKETMAMSRFKREYFAGTPLTTDNTINVLWHESNQLEWATKCEACNHWNMLVIDNNPMKMCQKKGFCCSRCDRIIDTSKGLWVEADASKRDSLIGYHLAQPILPHFNQDPKEWGEFYRKISDGKYAEHQVYNEAFGIAYDVGAKPITEGELERLCVLGPSRSTNNDSEFAILERNRNNYIRHTVGVDWGVNMNTSRTAAIYGAIRSDGIYEVWDAKIFQTPNYEAQIQEIAAQSNYVNALVACDSGPDPFRGVKLGQLTAPDRILMVRYGNGKLVQEYQMPNGATDWTRNRYVLHRSDCLAFVFRMLKGGKILFPNFKEMKPYFQDILAEFIQVKEGALTEELVYSHDPTRPDDFLHALCYAIIPAYAYINDPSLIGPSSAARELDIKVD